ncbi:DUF6521 family protein [Paraburkholderia hospita]|uniref:three component ABC system middle component n=1 Tax=Paraburkholderia hospita TaxID=169430 RepID=UPI003ECDF680
MTGPITPVSLDAFAETNAAFCSLILAVCVSSYTQTAMRPMPVTLVPLVLPIVLSGDLEASFSHLTEDSTLARWISKTPQVQFGLAIRIQSGQEVTREALQFALHARVLEIDDRAQMHHIHAADATKQLTKLGFGRLATNAQRIGAWLGALASDAVVYNLLGLEV